MPPSPNWDELPVWHHFQNGRHGNWQNLVFAYNSASRVDRNESSVSTPILFRVRNSIKAFRGFYDFYLSHDEVPVWRHFQNGRHGSWQNHVFSYNSASRADRNETSVSTPIFVRVGNSIKALTSFYDFYLTHDELPVWHHFQNDHHKNWQNHVFAYNSASRVHRNESSVSTPIFLRVENAIKALTSFYNFYLSHDELPVWHHFQNGCPGDWQYHVFAYNSASKVNRKEISVSTLIVFRVRNSIKAFTGFYDFYLTHDELPVWGHFQNGRHKNWRNQIFSYNSASRVDRNEN